jgi:hypothetical protein
MAPISRPFPDASTQTTAHKSQYRAPHAVPPLGTRFERWRFWCPYGRWTCADGREVLFNRHYIAIYQRRPGKGVRVADHGEWVPWVEQSWFFNDGTSPVSFWSTPSWRWQPALERVNVVLAAWSLPPMRPRPRRSRRPRPQPQLSVIQGGVPSWSAPPL